MDEKFKDIDRIIEAKISAAVENALNIFQSKIETIITNLQDRIEASIPTPSSKLQKQNHNSSNNNQRISNGLSDRINSIWNKPNKQPQETHTTDIDEIVIRILDRMHPNQRESTPISKKNNNDR
jgi:hypothetical protein